VLQLREAGRVDEQVITLEKFDIDYRSDGSVGQYRSILTESDLNGHMEQQKEIYVNEPMRFGGVTIYQARSTP
jgi:cytochrome c biogenesis protein